MENDQALIRKKKLELTEQAIRDGGFYGNNGIWNSIITFSGDKRLYRKRVETIIVKDKKFVFVKKKPNGDYFLPGGSTEKNVPDIDQAVNECREEAHINVKNIQSTGMTYRKHHEVPNWCKKMNSVEWNGTVTDIYVAEYDSIYKGKIDKDDEDPFIRSGSFYPTKECFKFFNKEHREALLWYLKSFDSEDLLTESYITNYFRNRKLLKKLSNDPDVSRSVIDETITKLDKKFMEMYNTPEIKKERKQPDVCEIFHPFITFQFNDGTETAIAFCFDDSEITDGSAIHLKDYGNIVVLYPCFFRTTKENKIFTILHEMGHIRLDHLKHNHSKRDLFGNDISSDYRLNLMNKGRVMYPEKNADLYAILNGASMYSILSSAIKKDSDKKYDYRFTNEELANRYNYVFRRYGKLKGYNESSVSSYDIACLAAYEMVYENKGIEYLSEHDKNDLYTILFEYGVQSKIDNDESVKEKEKNYNNALTVYKEKYDEFKNIISNTIDFTEDNDNESDIFTESSNITRNTGETYIHEKAELFKLKTDIEKCYDELLYEYAKVFDEYGKSLDDTKNTVQTSNPKILYMVTEKAKYTNDMMNTINDMILKLKHKQDSVIAERTKEKIEHYLYLMESLTSSDRKKIPEEKFGIPETRSYPLDTKKHVHSAVVLFGRSEKKYRKELSERIFKAMEEFDLSTDMIGPKSQLYRYLPEEKRK